MTEDIHALAGAYALDAVTDLERAAFARHVAGCEACELEVVELRAAAARLADLTRSAPPPRLRDDVLSRVARTRQLSPGGPARESAGSAALLRWRRWTAAAVAAGIIAVGAGAATFAVQEQRVRDERARTAAARTEMARIEAVLTAPDATVHRQPAKGSGTVTVVEAPSRDAAVVVLAALPPPRPDQAYQLWLGKGRVFTSAGVLAAGQGSSTTLVGDLGDADLVGVSLEPASGSPQPTKVVGLVQLA